MSAYIDYHGQMRGIFSAIAMLSHEQGGNPDTASEAVGVICTLADIGIGFADILIEEDNARMFARSEVTA